MFKKGFSALLRGVEAVLEGLGTKSPTVIALGGHPETHILGETFYSQAPLRWGDYVAKVAVAPVSPELTALTGAALNVNGKPNGLREAVAAFFAAQAGVWEIRAQLLTNRETMPVEDASVPWPEAESPYRPVARITVPRQEAWSDAKARARDDGLVLSPWHGLAAHRPLDALMRAPSGLSPLGRLPGRAQRLPDPRAGQRGRIPGLDACTGMPEVRGRFAPLPSGREQGGPGAVLEGKPAWAGTSRIRSGSRRAMTSRTVQSALLALALVAGSAGIAAAQSTPNGNTSSPGAPAGDNSTGNGATGSGAAPSGR